MKLLLLALCCLPLFGESLQLDQEATAESGLSVLVMRQEAYPLPVLGMPPGRRGVMILIKNDTADTETTYFQVSVQRSDGRPMTALFPRSVQPYSSWVVWANPDAVTSVQVAQVRLSPAPAGMGPGVSLEMVADPVEFSTGE